eukprot:4648731-Prymnesium_polylepis.1
MAARARGVSAGASADPPTHGPHTGHRTPHVRHAPRPPTAVHGLPFALGRHIIFVMGIVMGTPGVARENTPIAFV